MFTLVLSGCNNKEQEYISQISDLKSAISNKDQTIADLVNIIEECNNNILDSKGYIGESYDEMESALDALEECVY